MAIFDRIAVRAVHRSRSRVDRFKLTKKPFIRQVLLTDDAIAEAVKEHSAETSVSEADPVLAKLEAQLAEAELDAGAPSQAAETAASALAAARATLPAGNIGLGQPLYALARAKLALERPDEAEPLLREALAARSPPLRADDLRVLEVKSALVVALSMRHRADEAEALRREIEPQLRASSAPYASDLIERMPKS